MYAARWDIDAARGHLDTAICQLTNAAGHLEGARNARAVDILDRLAAGMADLDRLREGLADR